MRQQVLCVVVVVTSNDMQEDLKEVGNEQFPDDTSSKSLFSR
jgi:hypothetical protein